MPSLGERMTDGTKVPNEKAVAKWIGNENYKRWKKIFKFIDENYNGLFKLDDWLFGGKHGWYLRIKKSKSFCSFIPEKNRFLILIVFGGEERKKTELILKELHPAIRKKYKEAKTYHDGKWLVIDVDRDEIIEDIKKMLIIKRKPKR